MVVVTSVVALWRCFNGGGDWRGCFQVVTPVTVGFGSPEQYLQFENEDLVDNDVESIVANPFASDVSALLVICVWTFHL